MKNYREGGKVALHLRIRTGRDLSRFAGAIACPFTSISRSTILLDESADRFGVARVSGFCAVDAEEGDSLLREMGMDPATVGIAPVVWHPAESGLATFSAVRSDMDRLDLHPEFVRELVSEVEILLGLFAHLEGGGSTFCFLFRA